MEVEIVGRADADEARAVAAKPLLGFLVKSKDAPRIGQENLALLGQADAASVAHDEARADLFFKAFDVKADGRLSEVHLTRRSRETAGIADGYEGA